MNQLRCVPSKCFPSYSPKKFVGGQIFDSIEDAENFSHKLMHQKNQKMKLQKITFQCRQYFLLIGTSMRKIETIANNSHLSSPRKKQSTDNTCLASLTPRPNFIHIRVIYNFFFITKYLFFFVYFEFLQVSKFELERQLVRGAGVF